MSLNTAKDVRDEDIAAAHRALGAAAIEWATAKWTLKVAGEARMANGIHENYTNIRRLVEARVGLEYTQELLDDCVGRLHAVLEPDE